MNSFKLSVLLFLTFFMLSCGSSTNLTSEKAYVENEMIIKRSSNLIINIPSGWRQIDDNKERLFEIWLVNSENSASICFIPITIDPIFDTISLEEKINLTSEIILNDKKSSNENFRLISESSENEDPPRKSIYYKIGDSIQKSIIFGNNHLIYECLAYGNGADSSIIGMDNIFQLQNNLVKTAVIK